MKRLRKQTNCAVLADFRDATFAQSGPNSRFLRDFFAQNGASVHGFVRFIYFLEQSDEKLRGRNAKFRAPEFFFRGLEFFFRGSDEKIPVQKSFRGGFGTVFLSRWDFFPDTFPVSFCRRNPPTGFSDSRTSAPGVSRVPSKGQVLRGFHDILIPAWRVWLRFLRAVPTRRPNTRFSEGENEQIVNGPRMCHSVNGRRCAGGGAFPFAPASGQRPLPGEHCHYCGLWHTVPVATTKLGDTVTAQSSTAHLHAQCGASFADYL